MSNAGDENEPVVVFPFAVRYPLAHVSRLFAVRPEQARLELQGEHFRALFGPWRVDTILDNVESLEVTGPYAPWKVLGPAHLSFADGGLTFATNADEGLCICFRDAVSGLLPVPWVRHGSLTVTVEDPQGVKGVIERSLRAIEQAPSRAAAAERLVQTEHDAIEAKSTAELRDRAAALGISNVNKLSHQELVDAMESPSDHQN
jgi:hypothetical protein